MAELTRDQKIYLIQKVDRYALSDMRKEALKGYAKIYPISEDEIKPIAEFIMIRDETVREIAML
jgi:hypothetical protein